MATPPRNPPRNSPRKSRRDPARTAARTPRAPYEEGPLAPHLAALRPPAELVRPFTERGWWRAETVLHDVYRGAARHPHRTAIVSHHAHRPAPGRVTRISYAQLAACTDRFAHALDALGIRPADPVAFQLPNRWETCALLLACLRTGAVAVPVLPGYGARDLAAVLGAAQPRLCVVSEQWVGIAPARLLADLAPGLPWLRHRAVLGEPAGAGSGVLDFAQHFVRTAHERHRADAGLPLPPGPADRICLAVTSLGLHAAHRMALHTPNTLHASLPAPAGAGQGACFTALPLAALPALLHTVIGPLTRGGTVVLQELWDPEAALDLMDRAGVCQAHATPAQWAELAAAQERRPRPLMALRTAFTGGPPGPPPAALARRVRQCLRVPLRAVPQPAPRAGAASPVCLVTPGTQSPAPEGHGEPGGAVGITPVHPLPGRPSALRPHAPDAAEPALRADDGTSGTGHGGEPGRPPHRPYAPLAVWRPHSGGPSPAWGPDAGTGRGAWADLDESGRPRRYEEEVGGVFLLPVTEIEERLLSHPRVAEAAVVACTDAQHGELACAAVVPDGAPPTLRALREHLLDQGIAPAHLPARLELLGGLPRTGSGELDRRRLQATLARRPTGTL
ncbi:AMP-binding protein [Streptomyces sp. NPDC029674]|uniref:AMP-binding protein n=1 Tax=Streptomyces sp. NPDC029674 TaxID=3365297 RepID=UPI00384F787D